MRVFHKKNMLYMTKDGGLEIMLEELRKKVVISVGLTWKFHCLFL